MNFDLIVLKAKGNWQRGTAFVCGFLFLFLMACSGTNYVVDPQISKAELSQTLLTLADLPAGWSETPLDESEPSATIKFLCSEIERNYVVNGRSEFEFGGTGPFLTHQIYVYADEDAAQAAFASYQAAARECDTWSRELTDGSTIDWEVDGLKLDGIGTESFAIRSTSFNAPLYIRAQVDHAILRQGNAIMTVQYLGLGSGDLSVKDTFQFAELSLEKLSK